MDLDITSSLWEELNSAWFLQKMLEKQEKGSTGSSVRSVMTASVE